MPDPTLIIVLIAAGVVFLGGLYIVDRKQKGGWGPRNMQALGLVLVLPVILILAAMGKIENAVIATLLGAIIGYILGFRSAPDKDEK